MKTTIDMAREAGLFTHKEVQAELKAFEALVRADEREQALAAPTVQEPVALTDEQAEFESVFKLPSNCTKFQGGYAPTSYNAWEAQTFCARWEGWKARSAHGITAAQPVPTVPNREQIYKDAFEQGVHEGNFKAMHECRLEYFKLQAVATPPAAPVQECLVCNGMGFIDGVGAKCRRCDGRGLTLATTPPAAHPAPIPDAITDNSESPEYKAGWNECRELTIQMRKS
jgi:hypothetical protein